MVFQYTFESYDFAGWIHDGWICWNGSSDGVSWIMQVNDDHLCCFTSLLSDTDKLVRFHSKGTESNVGCIDADTGELFQTELFSKIAITPSIEW